MSHDTTTTARRSDSTAAQSDTAGSAHDAEVFARGYRACARDFVDLLTGEERAELIAQIRVGME